MACAVLNELLCQPNYAGYARCTVYGKKCTYFYEYTIQKTDQGSYNKHKFFSQSIILYAETKLALLALGIRGGHLL